jgi:hypothetical protein
VVMATIGLFGPRTTNLALEEIAKLAPVDQPRSVLAPRPASK